MSADEQLVAHARELIDANLYMTLGTVDTNGNPWVTPVFYATADYASFYWVSQTDAVHSRNLASRPQSSIVIFDSTVPAETGRAVYMTATAGELADSDLDLGLQIYPGPAVRGGSAVTRAEVRPPEPNRLYRAAVSACSVLCPREPGRPCLLHGIAVDHRTGISLAHLAVGLFGRAGAAGPGALEAQRP
jgi:Pyridoxamine 5'-phosphate oxidase